VFDYVDAFYNRKRRHNSIAGIPPITFETRHAETLGLAA
jgi:transposase InsO family protein